MIGTLLLKCYQNLQLFWGELLLECLPLLGGESEAILGEAGLEPGGYDVGVGFDGEVVDGVVLYFVFESVTLLNGDLEFLGDRLLGFALEVKLKPGEGEGIFDVIFQVVEEVVDDGLAEEVFLPEVFFALVAGDRLVVEEIQGLFAVVGFEFGGEEFNGLVGGEIGYTCPLVTTHEVNETVADQGLVLDGAETIFFEDGAEEGGLEVGGGGAGLDPLEFVAEVAIALEHFLDHFFEDIVNGAAAIATQGNPGANLLA